MNILPDLLVAIGDAMIGKSLTGSDRLAQLALLLQVEIKALRDAHVVYLDRADPDTTVDQDSEAYKGPGWYTTDESHVLSSGPHATFVEAAFESGRYVGAMVGTPAMATLDLCHLGTVNGRIYVQRLDHAHEPTGARFCLGAEL